MILLKNPFIEPLRHSERSEESRVFPDLRPFTSFRVTLKDRFSAESFTEPETVCDVSPQWYEILRVAQDDKMRKAHSDGRRIQDDILARVILSGAKNLDPTPHERASHVAPQRRPGPL